MARRIEKLLYCVKGYGMPAQYVEAENKNDLYRFIAVQILRSNWIVSSVTQLAANGTTPRVKVLTDPAFKAIYRAVRREFEEARRVLYEAQRRRRGRLRRLLRGA